MDSVSVVIPVRNRATLLRRAVDSVLFQTLAAREVVVVNDASDQDLGGIREYCIDSGIRWIDLPVNLGPAGARNAGAAVTDGEGIAFLDSDDEWMPAKLERQIAWHRNHPDMRISQVKERWFRNGSPVAKPRHWEQAGGEIFSASVERCSIAPSCALLRRDLWEETGGFDERYRVCEDYELWLRVTRSDPVGFVGGEELARRHGGHPDQLSTLVPAMDRYRVVALLELLCSGRLASGQRASVVGGLVNKARILAVGAEKRGRRKRARFYEGLASGAVGLGAAELAGLISSAWWMAQEEEETVSEADSSESRVKP